MLLHSKREVTFMPKSHVPIGSSVLSLTEVHKSWSEDGMQLKIMVTWKHCDTDAFGIFTSNSLHWQYKDSDTMEAIQITDDYRCCYQSTQVSQLSWYHCILFSWRVPVLARKGRSVFLCVEGISIHLFLPHPCNNIARANPRHVHVSQVRSVIALTGGFLGLRVI